MKIKTKMLAAYLESKGMTGAAFAREIGVDPAEVEKMLNGEPVDEPTARKFIFHLGADDAQHFIDWDAIGKVNPLANDTDDKGGNNNDV